LETEIPMSGGNNNAEVVRVGNTVRRAPSEHAQSIHALLQHIRVHGFLDCPEFLGMNDKGRERLSYIGRQKLLHFDCAEKNYKRRSC